MPLTAPADRARTDRAPADRARTDRARTDRPRVGPYDADGMAVASFVLGLVGLLAMNLVLGPAALVLATLALRRGTTRRFRAFLGLGLGVADLVVLFTVIDANNALSWSFGG